MSLNSKISLTSSKKMKRREKEKRNRSLEIRKKASSPIQSALIKKTMACSREDLKEISISRTYTSNTYRMFANFSEAPKNRKKSNKYYKESPMVSESLNRFNRSYLLQFLRKIYKSK